MKKSKIIGLSLGLTALAATAVGTTFIVTSCSSTSDSVDVELYNSNFSNIKLGTSLESMTGTISNEKDDVITGKNTATIYIRDSKFISFDLNENFDINDKALNDYIIKSVKE